MSTLSERVREARRACGYTQDELAEVSGLGRVSIARIETGAQTNPTLATLRALARALLTTVGALVDGAHLRGAP